MPNLRAKTLLSGSRRLPHSLSQAVGSSNPIGVTLHKRALAPDSAENLTPATYLSNGRLSQLTRGLRAYPEGFRLAELNIRRPSRVKGGGRVQEGRNAAPELAIWLWESWFCTAHRLRGRGMRRARVAARGRRIRFRTSVRARHQLGLLCRAARRAVRPWLSHRR